MRNIFYLLVFPAVRIGQRSRVTPIVYYVFFLLRSNCERSVRMWGSFCENSRSYVIFLSKDYYRGFGLSLFSRADPKPISDGERKITPIKAPFWIAVLPACQHVCSCSRLALAATCGLDGKKAGAPTNCVLRTRCAIELEKRATGG